MSLRHLTVGAAAVLMLAVSGVSLAAQGTLKEGDLANIKALKCTFPVSARVVWKDGVPTPTVRTTALLTIDISEIDAADGSAVVGSVGTGSHDVNMQVYGWNMHFLEASAGGRLGVTTVFAQYSSGEKLKAVHSRTDFLPIDLGPSFRSEPEVAQYWGECEARR